MNSDDGARELFEIVTTHYLRGSSMRECLLQVGKWLDQHPEVRPPEARALENLVRASRAIQTWTDEQEAVARDAVLGMMPENTRKQIALMTLSRQAAETIETSEQKRLDKLRKALHERRSRPVYEVHLRFAELTPVHGTHRANPAILLKKRLFLVLRDSPSVNLVQEMGVEIWTEDQLMRVSLPKDVCEDVAPLLSCGCKHRIQAEWDGNEDASDLSRLSLVVTLFLPTCNRPDVTSPSEVRALTAPPRTRIGFHLGLLIGLCLLLLVFVGIIRSC